MGSSKDSLSGIGLVDVSMNLAAFEAINRVQIEVRLGLIEYHGSQQLSATAIAHRKDVPIGEAPPLASMSVTCSAIGLKSLEAAVIHLLYLLDGRLAGPELADAKTK